MSGESLTDLLTALPEALRPRLIGRAGGEVHITGITQDSRAVTPGMLFAAIPGTLHNGEDYIEAALASGAAAVLCRPEIADQLGARTAVLADAHPRRALSLLAAAYFQPQPPACVAVTGTDGKTSTAEFIRQLWELTGHAALSIGTLGLKTDQLLRGLPVLSDNTSPEPVAFYQALTTACQQGVLHAVVEASSHGLDQYRLEGMEPRAAVFTSFSQDHLDYHGTMEAYFQAKERLFIGLLHGNAQAILCEDYSEIAALAERLSASGRPVVTYGRTGDACLRAVTPIPSGQHVVVGYEGQDYTLRLPLFGEFQAYNVIAAMLAVAATTHLHLAELVAYADKLTPIRGRLELVGRTAEGAPVFVDYAHTPGALEKALHTLRPYVSGQLHVVFGCGGNRDALKRPKMGEVAARLADVVIVTDDNPRHEDAASIRAAVRAGCPLARDIADRREAIAQSIRALGSGDVLLIAGKGHEDYQIIGETRYHLDDAEIAADVLGEMLLHAGQ